MTPSFVFGDLFFSVHAELYLFDMARVELHLRTPTTAELGVNGITKTFDSSSQVSYIRVDLLITNVNTLSRVLPCGHFYKSMLSTCHHHHQTFVLFVMRDKNIFLRTQQL